MARFGSLDTQYFDDAGDPLVSGKIYFYETGTTTPKNTYADVNNTILNTNPVILTAAGRQPNIFFSGVAKAILTKSDNTQILVRDPVGETESNFGDAWISTKTYQANDVVMGSNGEIYKSLVNNNTNNNPVTTTGSWTFLYSVEWNAGTTYKLGSVVTRNQLFYQSLQNANINKDPLTENTWWVPIQLVWSATATYGLNANVVGTDGILYTSLQAANINNPPATSPVWWRATSIVTGAINLATQVFGVLRLTNGGNGFGNIVSASSNTTLTDTGTLLLCTPTAYGMAVTLPAANSIALATNLLHAIDNRSDYFIRVLNNAGTLLGFIGPRVYTTIGLSDNTTAAGVWEIPLLRKDGIASQLATTVLNTPQTNTPTAIDMDGDIEIVYGYRASDSFLTAVAHRSSTGAYGTPVVVRSAAVATRIGAITHTATQALFVSCTATTAFEAVIVSVNTSTLALTVNTAATATLAGNITNFVPFSTLIAIPSLADSFVTSYYRATTTSGIRAISISGTTVTIGAETALTGTAAEGGLGIGTGDKVLFVSRTSANLYAEPFTVSGSTLTVGTSATNTAGGNWSIARYFALGTRFCVLSDASGTGTRAGAIITLTGTTATVSRSTNLFDKEPLGDAMVISSSKVLVLSNDTGSGPHINILTDSSGTASAGTAIAGNNTAAGNRRCLWANASTAAISEGASGSLSISILDVSGASPVVLRQVTTTLNSSPLWSASTANLTTGANAFYGTDFARKLLYGTTTESMAIEVTPGGTQFVQPAAAFGNITGTVNIGRNSRERWIFNAGSIIKLECAA